ncbi:hypothetical protein MKEN_00059300 [Mycena kentingensis (nom. inval.)]|nr:hypothetical protein MKEN_00059300 [Mycena kentingensis (nom. inval.)]
MNVLNALGAIRLTAGSTRRLPLVHVRYKAQRVRNSRVRAFNRDIPFDSVHLKHEGDLVETTMQELLKQTDLKTDRIELVVSEPFPIVEIINMREQATKERAQKEKLRGIARREQRKEVQFTWGSAQSDIDHRLTRVGPHLDIGGGIDIVFSTKTRTVPPHISVQKEKVNALIERVTPIATLWRPTDWRKNLAVIYLRGIKDAFTTHGLPAAVASEGGQTAEISALKDDDGAVEEITFSDDTMSGEQVDALSDEEDRSNAAETEIAVEPASPIDASSTPSLPENPYLPFKRKERKERPTRETHRNTNAPSTPPKAKNFVDLSEMGYSKPNTRNPFAATRKEKKYGSRKQP